MKPIWQVPSKEVVKIFDDTAETGTPETGDRRTGRITLGQEGFTNLAAGVAPEEKVLCYRIRNQRKGTIRHLKPRYINLSGLTGLEVWEGSV